MVALSIFAKLFGAFCIVLSLVILGVGFAAFNENDDHMAATILAIVAIMMFIAGLHFFTPVAQL